jgi:membrane fusion protein (multidrug efflux system)
MAVEEGDLVKAGQEIARLDETAAKLTVERLRLALEDNSAMTEAEVGLAQAQDDLEAAKALAETISASERRTVERRFELARVKVDRAKYQKADTEVQLKMAEKQLADRRIRAPIDGVVVTKHREAGESVDADTHTPVVTLIDVSRLRAEVVMPVEKYTAIHLDQRATITCDALPDRRLEGKVVFIEPVVRAEADQFKVKVEFVDPSGQTRPGMRATVRIAANQAGGGE